MGNFPIKPVSVKLLGLEYSINPQNLMKIVSLFLTIEILIFLSELPLILKDGRKRKNRIEILQENLDIEFQRDLSAVLGAMLGNVLTEN